MLWDLLAFAAALLGVLVLASVVGGGIVLGIILVVVGLVIFAATHGGLGGRNLL